MVTELFACNLQVCCATRLEAVAKGHYACFTLLVPDFAAPHGWDVYPRVSRMLRDGNVIFARHLFSEHAGTAFHFAEKCIEAHDTLALQFVISATPNNNRNEELVVHTISHNSIRCLRALLDSGVPFHGVALLHVAVHNHLDILELMLVRPFHWCPRLPGQAACAGNVRFLMRIFAARCPVWDTPIDWEPVIDDQGHMVVDRFVPLGQHNPQPLPDWSFVVSSDLLLCGPVLLYAAQMGARLTPRMQAMLVAVRRRTVALVLCFHRANRLGRAPGPHAQWGAMGQVPAEMVQIIATPARISIVADDLVT